MPVPIILAGIGHYVVNQATDYIKTNAGQFIRNRLADAGLQDTWLFRQLQGANEWQQGNTPTSFSIRIGRKTRMKYTSENTRWKLKGNRDGVSFDISWGQPDQANAYAPEQHNASHAHGVPYHQLGVEVAPDGFPVYRKKHYGPDIRPTATFTVDNDEDTDYDSSAHVHHSDSHLHDVPYRKLKVEIAPDGFPVYRKKHYGQDISPTSTATIDNDWDFDYDPSAFGPDVPRSSGTSAANASVNRASSYDNNDWDFDYDPSAFGPDVPRSSETLAVNASANRASSHNERAHWVSPLNSRFDAADFIFDEELPSHSQSSASTIANAVADSFTSVSNSFANSFFSLFKPVPSNTQQTVESIGHRLSAYFSK